MTSIQWKINRLRTMSPLEIGYRVLTHARIGREKSAVLRGDFNSASPSVSTRCLLFDIGGIGPPDDAELEHVDQLIAGKLGFFGDAPIDVGTTPDWLTDPTTGTKSPLHFHSDIDYRDEKVVGNIKILWELNRHQHLVPLAVAYCATGQEKYRDALEAHISSWIAQNPVGMGVNWSSSLECALRLVAWSIVHSLLVARDGGNGLFDLLEPEEIGAAIYQQARHITAHLSRFSSANNHLIGELTGLWVGCSVFNLGADGARWAESAKRELETEAEKQVYSDGVNKEQASYYHVSVLEYLFLAWAVGKRTGNEFSTGMESRIRAMARFARAVTPSGGKLPQIGDSDDGFVARFTLQPFIDPVDDVLMAVDCCLGRKQDDADWRRKSYWYQLIGGSWPAEDPADDIDKHHDGQPRVFADGGYAIVSAGKTHIVFDAGPLGYSGIAAHGHADALSFCMALGGRWWMVDPGTYIYHREPEWRDYFRGTSAHSTVTVDGENQSQIAGPFMWLRKANARIIDAGTDKNGNQFVLGEHDGYQGIGVKCRRNLLFVKEKNQLVITDSLTAKGEHRLTLNFHFHPDVRIAPQSPGVFEISHQSDSSRLIVTELDSSIDWTVAEGQESPILGWYSSKLGSRRPAPTLHGGVIAKGDISIRSVFEIRDA